VRLQNWFQFAWGVCQIGFCSRDSHVVPKKKKINSTKNWENMMNASFSVPLWMISTYGGPFKTDLIWYTALSTYVDELI